MTRTIRPEIVRPGKHQRGVALAVVVWFIAGMSLLVAGVVMTARTDVRLAQIHSARAEVTAAGDGAINLLLADLVDRQTRAGSNGVIDGRYQLGEDFVRVVGVSEDLLVDPNVANAAQIARSLADAGFADGDSAQAIGRAVVQYRNGNGRRRAVRFESFEDLLSVPGFNRALLDAARDYLVVYKTTGPALGQGADTTAGETGSRRGGQGVLGLSPVTRARHPELAPSYSGGGETVGFSGLVRVDAMVRRGSDVWLRRRWARVGGGQSALPWQFTRTEPVRMVPREQIRG